MEQKEFKTKFLDQEIPCYYIKQREDAAKALSILMNQNTVFGIDTETEALPQYKGYGEAGLSPHLAKIRLIQVFNDRAAVVFDMKFIEDYQMFIPFLTEKKFVAHNALFDLSFFKKMGVQSMTIGCTYILSKCIMHSSVPTDEGLKASLEAMIKGIFKTDILKVNQASDWSEPELNFEQIEYAALDAVAVRKLAEELTRGMTKYKLENYYKLCKAAQHPISELQLNGLTLDVEAHQDVIATWVQELFSAKKKLLKLTGLSNITDHTTAEWLEKHLDIDTLAIWPRSDTGKLQTDANTFADFSFLPIVEPFTEFQKLKKLTTSFGSNLLRAINPATGKLHAQYRICGARTGRLSCSHPNLQQLPRSADVRKHFIAGPGKVFLVADYSQIELRVAAELSQDREMLNAYRKGIDLHALTASKVARKPLEEVTKDERQMAKAVNFGLLFGLGAKKFSHYAKKSYGVEISKEDAHAAVAAFRTTYSGYYKWQMAQADRACQTLYTRTPVGKLRRLDPENTYGTAMNTPVQGGAAECMLSALVRLHRKMTDAGVSGKLVNCVHDEVMVECPPCEVRFLKDMIEESMKEGFLDVFPKGVTKGICEVGQGKNWGDAKK